jgi:hypothetical protein
MKSKEAYTVSIGLLAVVDTYLTATILPLPVWVTFIAWASFFIVGGGNRGFVQSVASNLTGLAISSATLLGIALAGSSPMAAAILVGVGRRNHGRDRQTHHHRWHRQPGAHRCRCACAGSGLRMGVRGAG